MSWTCPHEVKGYCKRLDRPCQPGSKGCILKDVKLLHSDERMNPKVVVKKCLTYDLDKLEEVLAESLRLVGGPSIFFKQGERVLVKPNLLTDAKPEDGITTHPNFVQAAIRILKKAGLNVAIADIPGEHKLEANVERVYKTTGMQDVAKRENVELLRETKFIEEDGVIFANWVREFDHIVSLPKFKTHSLATLTGAVKNIFGLTPRLYRVKLHKQYIRQDDFAKMLLDVYKKCRPTLSFVDGIVAMEGNGPAHDGMLRNVGLVAVSSDALALDSLLAYVMGIEPLDIATNRQGGIENLGATDLEDIEVLGDRLEDFKTSDFKLPPNYLLLRLPKPAIKILGRLAEFRPRVDRSACNGCRICIENCPLSAIELKDKKARIDYSRCVDCFCCLEVCPIGAMKTKSGPLIYALKFRERFKKLINALSPREVVNVADDVQVLDLRPMPPFERHEKIFQRWGTLKAGETLRIINDHDPKPLRYQFEVEYKDKYEWDYKEKGPKDWVVNIKKRG